MKHRVGSSLQLDCVSFIPTNAAPLHKRQKSGWQNGIGGKDLDESKLPNDIDPQVRALAKSGCPKAVRGPRTPTTQTLMTRLGHFICLVSIAPKKSKKILSGTRDPVYSKCDLDAFGVWSFASSVQCPPLFLFIAFRDSDINNKKTMAESPVQLNALSVSRSSKGYLFQLSGSLSMLTPDSLVQEMQRKEGEYFIQGICFRPVLFSRLTRI